MSARRQARERDTSEAVEATGGIPAALLIGACFEVWAPESKPPDWWADRPREWAWISTRTRWSTTRGWWLESAGLNDSAEAAELLPSRNTWCFEHLSYIGQSERAGRPADEIVDERFARAGVSRANLPELRAEAQTLYVLASRAEKARRSHTSATT